MFMFTTRWPAIKLIFEDFFLKEKKKEEDADDTMIILVTIVMTIICRWPAS